MSCEEIFIVPDFICSNSLLWKRIHFYDTRLLGNLFKVDISLIQCPFNPT